MPVTISHTSSALQCTSTIVVMARETGSWKWPALAFGLASPEQGRKLIATADARLAQLAKQYGYPGSATVAALWPAPAEAISPGARQRLRALYGRDT